MTNINKTVPFFHLRKLTEEVITISGIKWRSSSHGGGWLTFPYFLITMALLTLPPGRSEQPAGPYQY